MKPFPHSLEALLDEPFLTSADWERFCLLTRERHSEIQAGESVLCAEADPVHVLAILFATLLQKGGVFLANPNWGASEWGQLSKLTSYHRVFGTQSVVAIPEQAESFEAARVMIPSGGSSGTLRFCVHSLDTLSAAVESLFEHHGKRPLNSMDTLPIFHVSGLMPVWRAALTGGVVRLVSWKELEQGDFPKLPGFPCSLSLVPTQLFRLLKTDGGLSFLHRMDTIYLGGAGTPPGLVQYIRGEKLPVEFVYGMTETAAMVVYGTRGDSDESGAVWGQALPGVLISLNEEQEIVIQSKSLFRGYFPEDAEQIQFRTGDLGRWVTDELMEVIGRKDFLINSGGEKVNPEEVEACLASLLPGVGVAVGSKPNDSWGELVVALIESELSKEQLTEITQKLASLLAPFKLPKEFLTGVEVPRSALGKVNRLALRQWLEEN